MKEKKRRREREREKREERELKGGRKGQNKERMQVKCRKG